MSTEFFNDQWRIPSNENQNKVSNYSCEFDGSNDFITISNPTELTDDFTISAWIFPTRVDSSYEMIYTQGDGTVPFYFSVEDTKLHVYITGIYRTGLNFITANEWQHVAVTRTSGVLNLYRNGVEYNGTRPTQNGIINNNSAGIIGKWYNSSNYFKGKIDQTCIFDYALPATGTNSIATLYGGGTAVTNPMSLSPAPVAYYQLGDQSVSTGTSADYLVPNNSLNGSVGYSPYALTLDSSNANSFTLDNGGGNGLLNAATSFTISTWINPNQPASFGNIFTHFTGGVMFRFNSSGNIQLYVTKENNTFPLTTAFSALTFTGNWQHVVAIYDGSFLKIYVDNVLVNTPLAFSDTLKNDTSSSPDIIGNRINTTQFFDGEISNVAVWKNSVIDVNTLYNQGLPSDLTSLNPSGWWQMGSNSSFNATTSKWTCLNEGTARTSTIPSNATTLVGNMTNDQITNGVGYSANGLGTSSIDIVGDAPYSSANGLSENMDVLDRVEDVPG